MTAGNKKPGPSAHPAIDSSATGLPGLIHGADLAPDAGLSAAFRQALGARPGEAHLPVPPLSAGTEIAKRAKADRPNAPLKTAPRKANIGPRSGHK